MINIFKGLNNKVSPTSAAWEAGYASLSTNCRIDDNMTWAQGPSLGAAGATLTTKSLGAGKHFKVLPLSGTRYILTGIGAAMTVCSGPNGLIYYVADNSDTLMNYDGTTAAGAGLARFSGYPTIAVSGIGARMEDGLYYYMATIYDATKDVESLASYAAEHYVAKRYENDARVADVPNLSGVTSSGKKIRYYRSLCIPMSKGDTVQRGSRTSPTNYYFIGEVSSGTTFTDYAHDSEIAKPENLYTGRGNQPPAAINCVASFDDRLFCFKDQDVYWSSAGRPEEFPQAYTMTIRQDYSVGVWTTGTYKDKLTKGSADPFNLTLYPLLDTGVYGEAKMTIPELASSTVILAREWRGKLWFWTESATFYIEKSNSIEGYRYVKVADGIGVSNPNATDVSPYGLFGFDGKSIWLLSDTIKRIGEERITMHTTLTGSFGVWVDTLKEFWCCEVSVGAQIAYRADMDAFVGPYALDIDGGCSYTDNATNQAYLTDAKKPILTTREGDQSLKFWFGDPYSVKENVKIEVIYLSNNDTVSAIVYQNNIASETNATSSGTYSHTSANLVGMMEPRNSGRFFEIHLAITSSKIAPIAAINFTYDPPVVWGERNRR